MYAETRRAGFGAEVKRRIMIGTYALSAGYFDAYYGQAQRVRTLIRRDFDARRSPTGTRCCCRPRRRSRSRIGAKLDDPLAMYANDVFTLPVNLAGLPGLSIPCGLDGGLPVGLPGDRPGVLREPAAADRRTRSSRRSASIPCRRG